MLFIYFIFTLFYHTFVYYLLLFYYNLLSLYRLFHLIYLIIIVMFGFIIFVFLIFSNLFDIISFELFLFIMCRSFSTHSFIGLNGLFPHLIFQLILIVIIFMTHCLLLLHLVIKLNDQFVFSSIFFISLLYCL